MATTLARSSGDFSGSGQSGILWRDSGGDTELWNPNGCGGFVGEDLGVVSQAGRLSAGRAPSRRSARFAPL
jgi:hypothetical protein